jgi:hypothetical protein
MVCGHRAGFRRFDGLVRDGAAAGQNALEQADARMRHKLSGVNLNAIMELNLIIALALAFGIGLSLGAPTHALQRRSLQSRTPPHP